MKNLVTGTTPEKTGADKSETPGTSGEEKTEPGPSTSGEGMTVFFKELYMYSRNLQIDFTLVCRSGI